MMLRMQGPDGLLYWPVVGRPWARTEVFGGPLLPPGDHYTIPYDNGRLLGAIAIYYSLTGEPIWREVGERVVQGLSRLLVDRQTEAYFHKIQFGLEERVPPDAPIMRDLCEVSCAGWVIQGLAQFFRSTRYGPAATMAGKLSAFLRHKSGVFGPRGQFTGFTHFHHHTLPLLALLDYGLVAGDRNLVDFVRLGYEFGKNHGEPLVGYFPENINVPAYQTSETCEVADMLALAVKLASAGFDGCWDDADRWVRNQFAEGQLMSSDWVKAMIKDSPATSSPVGPEMSVDKVVERCVGGFAGWPSANDWQGRYPGQSIMQCCTGNGARTLYYVWEHIVTYREGRLKVNLLLNRASPWADVDSSIPYDGRVDLKIKQSCQLSMRIPEWVKPGETKVRVDDVDRLSTWDGRYVVVGQVAPHNRVTLTFPISERIEKMRIQGKDYTLTVKGNDVVRIDPPGRYCPLYQRGKYRDKNVHLAKMERFVAKQQLEW
jgi:hypothetical protein